MTHQSHVYFPSHRSSDNPLADVQFRQLSVIQYVVLYLLDMMPISLAHKPLFFILELLMSWQALGFFHRTGDFPVPYMMPILQVRPGCRVLLECRLCFLKTPLHLHPAIQTALTPRYGISAINIIHRA